MQVYKTMFELNVLGQIALTKAVLPVMVEQGAGHLLVTSSVAGKVGVPLRTGYCAAKHAVVGFFDSLRSEVAYLGIRVTTIIPGFIRTSIGSNALTGSGQPTGKPESDIDAGMDVSQCAGVVLQGIADGLEESQWVSGLKWACWGLNARIPQQLFGRLKVWPPRFAPMRARPEPPAAVLPVIELQQFKKDECYAKVTYQHLTGIACGDVFSCQLGR